MIPEPLTDADVELCLDIALPEWVLERLDTRWGTERCVGFLKSLSQCRGVCTDVPEGLPYSDGKNPEWWAFRCEQETKGYRVWVMHEFRDGRPAETVREGRLPWNRIANNATGRAFKRFGSSSDRAGFALDVPPAPGEQLALTV